jgi:single-stranded-DNA-specific exonuclease
LLSTDSVENARKFAQDANEVNNARQALTKQLLEEAIVAKRVIAEKLVISFGNDWEEGIIGLVAGKLMNKVSLPSIAISVDVNRNIAKGSARSFGSFDITAFFTGISDSFERFGGHQNAAGFTLRDTDVEKFIVTVTQELDTKYTEYIPLETSYVDDEVSLTTLSDSFFEQLQRLEPFGIGNPQPLFLLRGEVAQFSVIGKQQNHVKLDISTKEGNVSALAFDNIALLSKIEQGSKIALVGRPKINEYMGRKEVNFIVEEILPASEI